MPPALAAAEVATTPSAARSVWASPLYRGATLALFLSGLGTSAAAPQITLFLVNDLHVSLTVHDDLQTTANPVADGVVSIVRMALTAGWVIGPVLGSILATAAGSRVMLAASGLCALAQVVPM